MGGEIIEDKPAPLVIPLLENTTTRESKEDKLVGTDAPDEASLEDYDRVPVEHFGEGLLRGMGWTPGGAVGRTNAKVVQPIEFVPRAGFRTGLGNELEALASLPPTHKKRKLKPGEKPEDLEPKVYVGKDGRIKHVRTLDDKPVALSSLQLKMGEGSRVSIIEGTHEGLYGFVTKIDEINNRVTIKLESSNQEVKVSKDEVKLLKPKTDPTVEKAKEKQAPKAFEVTPAPVETKQSKPQSKSQSSESKPKESSKSKNPSWLFPSTIVKIVSKTFAGGKYYLHKAQVIDVISADLCSAQLMNSKELLELDQKVLETVIPAVGEKVVVVKGPNKGRTAKVMQKAKGKAVIQFTADLSSEEISFDDICHYIGSDIQE